MKYQKIITKITNGSLSRGQLNRLRENAQRKLSEGDKEATSVIDALNNGQASDDYVLFMGFCPGADFNERLDIEWKEKGVCRFDYTESEVQLERFERIFPGDLVVLKKREVFGKTMKLYGHGRVTEICYDEDNIRYLKVDWSDQETIIEVPLMGANSTVDIKSMDDIEDNMPEEYFKWLELEEIKG